MKSAITSRSGDHIHIDTHIDIYMQLIFLDFLIVSFSRKVNKRDYLSRSLPGFFLSLSTLLSFNKQGMDKYINTVFFKKLLCVFVFVYSRILITHSTRLSILRNVLLEVEVAPEKFAINQNWFRGETITLLHLPHSPTISNASIREDFSIFRNILKKTDRFQFLLFDFHLTNLKGLCRSK